MFDLKEAEGTKRRHQVDTVVEGMYVRTHGTALNLGLTPSSQRDQPAHEELRARAPHR